MTWRIATWCFVLMIAATGRSYAAAVPTMAPLPTPTPYATATPMPGGASIAGSPAPLTLQQAKMIAVKQSPTLELARASLDLAGGTLEVANSAAYPNISASGNAGRTKGNIRAGAVGSATSALFTSNNISANISQLIFDAGNTYAKISSAKHSENAARLNALHSVDTVLFNVAQAFYTALQARFLYESAIEARKLAEVQEQLVEAQFKAGVASRADVLTAQLPVAQARLAEVQAANGEQSNIAALLNTMGLPSDTPVTLVAQPAQTVPVMPTYASVEAIAAAQRTDLQAANESFTAASRLVRAARAAKYPKLVATGSIGSATTGQDGAGNFATNGGNYTSTYNFGVALTMPIFDSGFTNGEVAIAEANERSAQANLTTTQLNVSLTVRQAYLAAQTAIQGVGAAKVELDQAQTVLDVTNAQFKAGVTTLPLLLNAQVGLTKARSDYINALFAAYTAEQSLFLAEGVISAR